MELVPLRTGSPHPTARRVTTAASRWTPSSVRPEHAATGRPLPRVTATDDSVPEPPTLLADIGRPWLTSDGAHPAAHRLRRTTVLASTHRRLPQRSARTLQGGADVCGVAGPADRFPSWRRRTGPPGTRKGRSRPRVSDRSGPGHRRPARVAGRHARGDRSTVRPLPARDAGRRRLARGPRAGGHRSSTTPPAVGRAPPGSPRRRPPRPGGPGADGRNPDRNAGDRIVG
jgi:hypothetical protein